MPAPSAPSYSALYNLLCKIDPHGFAAALNGWLAAAHGTLPRGLAIDGKYVRNLANDPADYRWSSYGEAIGGGAKDVGETARAGLVRVLTSHQGTGADAELWATGVSQEYRKLLMADAMERTSESVDEDGSQKTRVHRKGMSKAQAEHKLEREGEISVGKMLRYRIRYFTDGAVIGSRSFVNEAFESARERFGAKRKDGARKLRGAAAAVSAYSCFVVHGFTGGGSEVLGGSSVLYPYK